MADREKVIERLGRVSYYFKSLLAVGWQGDADIYREHMESVNMAIALLKKQEAKPMTEYDDGWDCPRCGLKLIGKTASGYPCDEFDLPNDEIVKYCPVCGQAVKWNDT